MNSDTPVPSISEPASFAPYVPDEQQLPEFTWPAVVTGTLLGIVFGASSLYLLLKVGMTVSASVPIAVLSITLFRVFSSTFGVRRTTILENNIVQTAGSAGESIAFGVGVTMPALLLLGFEMDPMRVITVSVLGGLLGVLMMIPLRRAFIVKQHGKLKYPEGTACAEVLIAGEKGGSTARMVFIGFGIAATYTLLMKACKLWANVPAQNLYADNADGTRSGLSGAQASVDVSPELLGVGFLIGPRVACLMFGGALLSYLAIGPLIAAFGANASEPVHPAVWEIPPGSEGHSAKTDKGLIRNMDADALWATYLRFIGAGAVAAGGIISMLRALPLIVGSIAGGIRDLRASRAGVGVPQMRTDSDLSMTFVLFGSLALVLVITALPQLGLGFSLLGIVGALMILLFGFLFVTVSSRLTGEVGSSSNPISGMTIATLLLVCLVFFVLDKRDSAAMLTALTVAAVVCIASSNGGTTSQDLKTGYLVGATPVKQQLAILVGALASAVAIAGTLLLLNEAKTHYTIKNVPEKALNVPADAPSQKAGRPYEDDQTTYRIVHVRKDDSINPGIAAGRFLVEADGRVKYRTDMPVKRIETTMDNNEKAEPKYAAPQPELFANIIEGILGGKLEWRLIIAGVIIALSLEFAGVPAFPVAVGMYIPLSSTVPIFVGGMVRWVSNRWTGKSESEAETETGPGVLLASGFIAGGTLCGLLISFLIFLPAKFSKWLDLGQWLIRWDVDADPTSKMVALAMYAIIIGILLWVAARRQRA